MSMTRKDFRVVATALRLVRPSEAQDPGAFETWRRTRNMVATELQLAYRNFRRDKFDDWTNS